jgi:hypothetical protein
MIKFLIPLIVILEAADGILTYTAVGKNLVREANPLLYATAGNTSFLIMKICGAFLSALLLWLVYRRFPKISYITCSIIMLLYTSIYIWNITILSRSI